MLCIRAAMHLPTHSESKILQFPKAFILIKSSESKPTHKKRMHQQSRSQIPSMVKDALKEFSSPCLECIIIFPMEACQFLFSQPKLLQISHTRALCCPWNGVNCTFFPPAYLLCSYQRSSCEALSGGIPLTISFLRLIGNKGLRAARILGCIKGGVMASFSSCQSVSFAPGLSKFRWKPPCSNKFFLLIRCWALIKDQKDHLLTHVTSLKLQTDDTTDLNWYSHIGIK